MKIVKLKSDLRSYLYDVKDGKTIAFVPTMGSLHQGHLSLIKSAIIDCDIVICSIFVNPLQFNDSNDFVQYPRPIEDDIAKLQSIDCDILYCPNESDLYLENEKRKYFDLNGLDKYMEGVYRKDHFQGVATIVVKLFEIVLPDKAFFGQKDLQQLQIIKHITKELDLDVQIVSVPTVRNHLGLALSSRHKHLSSKDLKEASIIYDCLEYVKENHKKSSIDDLRNEVIQKFNKYHSWHLEYFEIVDLETLNPINSLMLENKNAACIAVSIDGTRLIDNIIF